MSATQRSFHTSLWKPEGDEGARLWEHQSLDNAFMEGRLAVCNIGVNTDQLNEIACDLIWKRWLRLDELEWVIVDALVFREVFEFGEALKQGFGPRDRANFAEGRLSPGMFSQGWAYFAAEGNPRNMVLKRLQVSIALWILRMGVACRRNLGRMEICSQPFLSRAF